MMQNQKLLVGLTVLAIALTGLMLQMPEQNESGGQNKALPDLVLDEVTGVELVADGATVSLKRTESGWVVEEKSAYPASFEALSELLLQLADLTIAEEKTKKPENHARLGVADSGEGAGARLTLNPGGQQLIVGESSASRGSYFRFAGEAQVYLSEQPLLLETDILSWLDTVIVNVDAESVRVVSIATEGAQYLSAGWDEASAALQVNNVPEGRELQYDGIADTLGRLLVNLRLLDVEPYQEGFFIDPTVTRVTLDNGETIEVQSVQSGEEYWVTTNTEANAGWQFRVSEFTYRELNKSLEDLLKPLEEAS